VVSEEIQDHEKAVSEAISADQDKCIKQFVLNVDKNAKFHSNQQKADLSIAKNALEIKEDFNS
jgi:hypothetical protein